MKITEVVLDFDGTIADSFNLSVNVFNEISGEFGFKEIDANEIEKWRDVGFREVIKEVKIPIIKLLRIVKRVQKIQKDRIDDVKPFKGMLEVMKELKNKGYVLGILTSNSKENVESFFDKNKVEGIDYIYSGNNMFGKDKLIKKLLKDRKLAKEQVIYVGDEVRDVESCQKVGISIIAVSWGYNSKKGLEKTGANYLIDKPEKILEILN